MGMTCSICGHPERDEIELAALQGASNRAIARRFVIGRDSLARHMKAGHVPLSIIATSEQREDRDVESLYTRAEFLWARSRAILDAADRRPNVELAAVRELRACVELLGKLTGALAAQEHRPVEIALTFADGLEVPHYPAAMPSGVET
jgi:hypothetical protein